MDLIEELRTEPRWNQSLREELANSVSHALGLLATLAATPFLIVRAWERDNSVFFVGTCIYAATILLVYLGSTLYHAWPQSGAKGVLQVIDHAAIFLLIAGTYTPFTLGPLRGPLGWSILGIVWALAIFGVVLKGVSGIRRPKLSMMLYLGMGWLILIVIRPLALAIPLPGLLWLVAGGVVYTTGVFFFVRERVRFSHFVWHLFVLGGSVCHFVAVWYAV